ncbi:MAG: diguanylate cyclase [Acidobacteria bacterium]|nr:diguanylate cyclase [Acidobacteriota bacterium]
MLAPEARYREYLNARLRDALLHVVPPTVLICLAFVPFNLYYRPRAVRWEMAAISMASALVAGLYGLALWRRPNSYVIEWGGPALVISLIGLTSINAATGGQASGAAYLGVIILVAGAILVRWPQMMAALASMLIGGAWVWYHSPQDQQWSEMAIAGAVAALSGLFCFHVRAKAFQTSFATGQSEVEARLRYERATEGSHSALWEYCPSNGALTLAPRWAAMLGYKPGQLPATLDAWISRVHPDDRAAVVEALEMRSEEALPTFSLEHRIQCADGAYRWFLVSGKSSPDSLGLMRLAGSFVDIDDRIQLETHLRHEALHDRLTGLANRRLLYDRLEQSLARARRNPGQTFAVVFFDLDGFKQVNDEWGHAAGDRVLTETAERLRENCRVEDTLARLGGDEFVVLVHDASSRSSSEGFAQRIRGKLAQPIEVSEGHSVRVGSSCGIAWSGDGFATGKEMLEAADAAMYEAKRTKRLRAGAAERDAAGPDASKSWPVETESGARGFDAGLVPRLPKN